ncbi:MAG: hypothetical protein Q9210_001837 [Variospora velana]
MEETISGGVWKDGCKNKAGATRLVMLAMSGELAPFRMGNNIGWVASKKVAVDTGDRRASGQVPLETATTPVSSQRSKTNSIIARFIAPLKDTN